MLRKRRYSTTVSQRSPTDDELVYSARKVFPQLSVSGRGSRDDNTKLQPSKTKPLVNQRGAAVKAVVKTTPKKNKSKTVSFAASCKDWDGLENESGGRDFDDLVFQFFIRKQKIGDADILMWTARDVDRIQGLCKHVSDMCTRLSQADVDKPIPCLPKGGGKSVRLQNRHLPYLISLYRVLMKAKQVAGSERLANAV